MVWTRRLPPYPPPLPSSSLSTGRLVPPPPSSPPTCSSLRGQGSPPPLGWRAGGSGINPPPTRTFPPPLPRHPWARAGWTLRLGVLGGGVPAAPRPSTPSESGPGRGRGRGKGAGRRCSNLFPSPGGGCGSAPVCGCVPRPAHPPRPPPPQGGWGRLLKGSESGSGAPGWPLGIRTEEGGWARGAECCKGQSRANHISPALTGSRAAGLWGTAGDSPCSRSGPRLPDNPASFSLPALGLPLVGPAGPLPQPCLGAEPSVASPAGGRGGGLA